MVYCFLADGFEEVEAIAPVDMLRRAGVEVKTVGVTGEVIDGRHGIKVIPDIDIEDITLDESLEAVILPGGLPGATNLEESNGVQKAIDYANEKGKYVCAICAAPQILGHKGLLAGKKAIAYPGFEGELKECDEGDLQWVSREFLNELPKWEGDQIFLDLLWQDAPFFLLTLRYDHDKLVEAILDGKKIR
mgnify:CR=1 FL=1